MIVLTVSKSRTHFLMNDFGRGHFWDGSEKKHTQKPKLGFLIQLKCL